MGLSPVTLISKQLFWFVCFVLTMHRNNIIVMSHPIEQRLKKKKYILSLSGKGYGITVDIILYYEANCCVK